MNHRLALAQRFAPRIPDTSRSYAPGGARGRARAQQITHGRRRARVGKVEPVEVYMNPGDVVKIYRKIFDSDPTIWTLGFILFSVGAQLAEIRERAADVEDVGGGSLQLRLELERRVEDLESFLSDYIRILRAMGGDETVLDGIEIAEYTQTLAEHIFVQGWPDKIDYEAGEGSEVNPLPYGLIWEISSLTNQVWAMWHPITWIGDDPDVPWWEWIPVAIAAGWVEAINRVQDLVTQEDPGGGEGWGAQVGHAAEQTEAAVIEIGEAGGAAIGRAAAVAKKMLGAAAVGVGLGLLLLLGNRRR